MIYKVTADFKEDMSNILKELEKDFDFVFFREILYIAPRNYIKTKKEIENQKKTIRDIIKQEIFIRELDENNLKYEPIQIIEWCKQKFIEQDTKRFEAEKQRELKAYLKFMNDFEAELMKQIENNEE